MNKLHQQDMISIVDFRCGSKFHESFKLCGSVDCARSKIVPTLRLSSTPSLLAISHGWVAVAVQVSACLLVPVESFYSFHSEELS